MMKPPPALTASTTASTVTSIMMRSQPCAPSPQSAMKLQLQQHHQPSTAASSSHLPLPPPSYFRQHILPQLTLDLPQPPTISTITTTSSSSSHPPALTPRSLKHVSEYEIEVIQMRREAGDDINLLQTGRISEEGENEQQQEEERENGSDDDGSEFSEVSSHSSEEDQPIRQHPSHLHSVQPPARPSPPPRSPLLKYLFSDTPEEREFEATLQREALEMNISVEELRRMRMGQMRERKRRKNESREYQYQYEMKEATPSSMSSRPNTAASSAGRSYASAIYGSQNDFTPVPPSTHPHAPYSTSIRPASATVVSMQSHRSAADVLRRSTMYERKFVNGTSSSENTTETMQRQQNVTAAIRSITAANAAAENVSHSTTTASSSPPPQPILPQTPSEATASLSYSLHLHRLKEIETREQRLSSCLSELSNMTLVNREEQFEILSRIEGEVKEVDAIYGKEKEKGGSAVPIHSSNSGVGVGTNASPEKRPDLDKMAPPPTAVSVTQQPVKRKSNVLIAKMENMTKKNKGVNGKEEEKQKEIDDEEDDSLKKQSSDADFDLPSTLRSISGWLELRSIDSLTDEGSFYARLETQADETELVRKNAESILNGIISSLQITPSLRSELMSKLSATVYKSLDDHTTLIDQLKKALWKTRYILKDTIMQHQHEQVAIEEKHQLDLQDMKQQLLKEKVMITKLKRFELENDSLKSRVSVKENEINKQTDIITKLTADLAEANKYRMSDNMRERLDLAEKSVKEQEERAVEQEKKLRTQISLLYQESLVAQSQYDALNTTHTRLLKGLKLKESQLDAVNEMFRSRRELLIGLKKEKQLEEERLVMVEQEKLRKAREMRDGVHSSQSNGKDEKDGTFLTSVPSSSLPSTSVNHTITPSSPPIPPPSTKPLALLLHHITINRKLYRLLQMNPENANTRQDMMQELKEWILAAERQMKVNVESVGAASGTDGNANVEKTWMKLIEEQKKKFKFLHEKNGLMSGGTNVPSTTTIPEGDEPASDSDATSLSAAALLKQQEDAERAQEESENAELLSIINAMHGGFGSQRVRNREVVHSRNRRQHSLESSLGDGGGSTATMSMINSDDDDESNTSDSDFEGEEAGMMGMEDGGSHSNSNSTSTSHTRRSSTGSHSRTSSYSHATRRLPSSTYIREEPTDEQRAARLRRALERTGMTPAEARADRKAERAEIRQARREKRAELARLQAAANQSLIDRQASKATIARYGSNATMRSDTSTAELEKADRELADLLTPRAPPKKRKVKPAKPAAPLPRYMTPTGQWKARLEKDSERLASLKASRRRRSRKRRKSRTLSMSGESFGSGMFGKGFAEEVMKSVEKEDDDARPASAQPSSSQAKHKRSTSGSSLRPSAAEEEMRPNSVMSARTTDEKEKQKQKRSRSASSTATDLDDTSRSRSVSQSKSKERANLSREKRWNASTSEKKKKYVSDFSSASAAAVASTPRSVSADRNTKKKPRTSTTTSTTSSTRSLLSPKRRKAAEEENEALEKKTATEGSESETTATSRSRSRSTSRSESDRSTSRPRKMKKLKLRKTKAINPAGSSPFLPLSYRTPLASPTSASLTSPTSPASSANPLVWPDASFFMPPSLLETMLNGGAMTTTASVTPSGSSQSSADLKKLQQEYQRIFQTHVQKVAKKLFEEWKLAEEEKKPKVKEMSTQCPVDMIPTEEMQTLEHFLEGVCVEGKTNGVETSTSTSNSTSTSTVSQRTIGVQVGIPPSFVDLHYNRWYMDRVLASLSSGSVPSSTAASSSNSAITSTIPQSTLLRTAIEVPAQHSLYSYLGHDKTAARDIDMAVLSTLQVIVPFKMDLDGMKRNARRKVERKYGSLDGGGESSKTSTTTTSTATTSTADLLNTADTDDMISDADIDESELMPYHPLGTSSSDKVLYSTGSKLNMLSKIKGRTEHEIRNSPPEEEVVHDFMNDLTNTTDTADTSSAGGKGKSSNSKKKKSTALPSAGFTQTTLSSITAREKYDLALTHARDQISRRNALVQLVEDVQRKKKQKEEQVEYHVRMEEYLRGKRKKKPEPPVVTYELRVQEKQTVELHQSEVIPDQNGPWNWNGTMIGEAQVQHQMYTPLDARTIRYQAMQPMLDGGGDGTEADDGNLNSSSSTSLISSPPFTIRPPLPASYTFIPFGKTAYHFSSENISLGLTSTDEVNVAKEYELMNKQLAKETGEGGFEEKGGRGRTKKYATAGVITSSSTSSTKSDPSSTTSWLSSVRSRIISTQEALLKRKKEILRAMIGEEREGVVHAMNAKVVGEDNSTHMKNKQQKDAKSTNRGSATKLRTKQTVQQLEAQREIEGTNASSSSSQLATVSSSDPQLESAFRRLDVYSKLRNAATNHNRRQLQKRTAGTTTPSDTHSHLPTVSQLTEELTAVRSTRLSSLLR